MDIIEGYSFYQRQKILITCLSAISQRDLNIDFSFDDNLDLFCFYKYKNNKEKNKIKILDKRSDYSSILSESPLIFDESYKCYVGKYKGVTTIFGIKPYNINKSIEISVLNQKKEFSEIIFKTTLDLETNYNELVFSFGKFQEKNCLYALTKSFSRSVFIYVLYI